MIKELMSVRKSNDQDDEKTLGKRKAKSEESEQLKKHHETSTEYLDKQLKEDFALSKQMHADDLRALVRHHRVLNGQTKNLKQVDEFHVKECMDELKDYYQ